ncbi:membrane protein insertase YidC [Nocardia sp. CDC159]|uniref:Membrane protein insertase YidC n=1 Tax=Nocardia pulmonis TaxID=2951408 RepID=A0A9X2J1I8_9NOCA|nr:MULTISPECIES: membrane protein insertase YidC [Nocardia]MCM6778135.1 membrane protein insertase YidC [Nocardia pulmonis]MCM6791024.1 membrane protein insertase YidC [Nocardia sp. CDC159]
MLDFVYYPVSAVLWVWHTGFAVLFGAASGVSWTLAIVFLVVTVRLVLYRPFVAQVRFARTMAVLQPQIRQLQTRFADDRMRLAQEMRGLQREHKFNLLTGFLPILGQLVVFLGLYHVLRCFDHEGSNYVFSADRVHSFLHADLFGAQLSATLLNPAGALATILTLTIPLVLISATATHFTARAAIARQLESTPQTRVINPIMLWLLPVCSLLAGLIMPLGILIYFATTSSWTFLQQLYIHRKLGPIEPAGVVAGEE